MQECATKISFDFINLHVTKQLALFTHLSQSVGTSKFYPNYVDKVCHYKGFDYLKHTISIVITTTVGRRCHLLVHFVPLLHVNCGVGCGVSFGERGTKLGRCPNPSSLPHQQLYNTLSVQSPLPPCLIEKSVRTPEAQAQISFQMKDVCPGLFGTILTPKPYSSLARISWAQKPSWAGQWISVVAGTGAGESSLSIKKKKKK